MVYIFASALWDAIRDLLLFEIHGHSHALRSDLLIYTNKQRKS